MINPDHILDISPDTLTHILRECKFLKENETIVSTGFNTQTGVRLNLSYGSERLERTDRHTRTD